MEWKLAFEQNCNLKDKEIKTIKDIKKAGYKTISATVPGNVEIDLMREGIIDDIFFSDNTFKVQKLENMHFWYFTEFKTLDKNIYLNFEGIDTVADIYINGKKAKSTDNMMIAYDVYGDFKVGKNQVVVHIKPCCIEARKYDVPVGTRAQAYGYPGLYIRKPMHTFGWDIMPRIVSAGLWKDVNIKKIEADKIKEVYFTTQKLDFEENKAYLFFAVTADVSGDFITDYSIRVKGCCKDSSFSLEEKLWHTTFHTLVEHEIVVDNFYAWWPKNYGEPNLYETTVELLCGGEVVDTYTLNIGIKEVKLNFKEMDDDGGDFSFEVNGKKVFILGTNWVALDALHSRDIERVDKAVELADDLGCNMIRCWGGNVYESDRFFDLCDKKGIMVWQDFAFACIMFPQDENFIKRVEEEAIFQVKRLRNHPSLTIWAGDNECDGASTYAAGYYRDPNLNVITRKVLKKVVEMHDFRRPYLPSSPYISQRTYDSKLSCPEDHLWGPRDYFKGEYYKNSECYFASETGYHGFNSRKSLDKFLKNPEKLFDENNITTPEYLAHAASPEPTEAGMYSYRIHLAYNQVETLFNKQAESFDDFLKQSQISQAEAKKYFIERFRINKWRKTGIIWWNLLDGWPQVSDAVVDYYFTKKLAYSFIRRSQEPLCLMIDEPENGVHQLFGASDLQKNADITYTVTNITDGKEITSGSVKIPANSSAPVCTLSLESKKFYLIEWTLDGKKYSNHYFTDIIDIDYDEYMSALKKCNMDQFEGF